MNIFNLRLTAFVFAVTVLVFAIILSPYNLAAFLSNPKSGTSRFPLFSKSFSFLSTKKMTGSLSSKAPVYFISHGGPNIMYDTKHPVYPVLTRVGREITQKVRPKAVLAISAHWESSTPGVIEINSAEKTDLIYDYYGFPKHYYEHKFPNLGSPTLATKINSLLTKSGIISKFVTRGLDHGIFACFSVLFPPSSANSLFPDIPIVQVSLPHPSNDPEAYFALGKAVEELREEGVLVVCSGMAVHNLRDMFTLRDRDTPLPYAVSFDAALREAVESSALKDPSPAKGDGETGQAVSVEREEGITREREERMKALLKRPDAKRAHPTWEHLWPVFVAAGAGGGDKGERIWTLVEGAGSWAMFKFG